MPQAPPSAALPAPPEADARVERISVRGTRRVPRSIVRRAIAHREGAIFDSDQVARDVLAIWELEVFDDVSVAWSPGARGIELTYTVRERPRIGTVVARGAVRHAGELGAEPGLLYEPDRLQQRAADLERSLSDAGHRGARVALSGRSRGDRVDLCVEVVPGPRVLVERVEFVGNSRLSAELLRGQLHTEDGRINAPGGVYRPEALERDLLFVSAAYFDRGMLDAKIEPRVVETARSIRIAIEISEGPVYRIGKLELRGRLEGPTARYRELLGVTSGEVFSRERFLEGMARIEEQGGGELDVEPQTKLHPERGVVDVVLELRRR